MGSNNQVFRASSIAFPGTSAGSYIRSEVAGTGTGSSIGCWHSKRQLKALSQCLLPAVIEFNKFVLNLI